VNLRRRSGVGDAGAAAPTGGPEQGSHVDVPTPDDRIRAFVGGEYRQVVATVELVCGSLPTAEDAVQEALARAWEREARGEDIRSLGAWVTTVALNLARSQMRRWKSERRARDRLVPLQREVPDAPGASSEALAVRDALRGLSRRQREVTALRYYLGLDVAEIAAELGIDQGTVKSLLFRAGRSRPATRPWVRRRRLRTVHTRPPMAAIPDSQALSADLS
jgi:RNA polymerase sigma-70 factor (ECF subfamily)